MINNTVQTNSETQWGSAMLNKECKLHIGKRERRIQPTKSEVVQATENKIKWSNIPLMIRHISC